MKITIPRIIDNSASIIAVVDNEFIGDKNVSIISINDNGRRSAIISIDSSVTVVVVIDSGKNNNAPDNIPTSPHGQ